MKIHSIISFASLFLISFFLFTNCQKPNPEIRQAVENQLKAYPESRLQDFYKGFFQDEFGPGHIIDDVSVAREYFDLELEEMVSKGRHEAEPCGMGKNFVRVPMDLVKDGLIKDDDFFKAFMESSVDFREPDLPAWKGKWQWIAEEMEKMRLDIPDFEKDKKAIWKMLEIGEPVLHHSDIYNIKYDPHYRIMAKKQWEALKAKIVSGL